MNGGGHCFNVFVKKRDNLRYIVEVRYNGSGRDEERELNCDKSSDR